MTGLTGCLTAVPDNCCANAVWKSVNPTEAIPSSDHTTLILTVVGFSAQALQRGAGAPSWQPPASCSCYWRAAAGWQSQAPQPQPHGSCSPASWRPHTPSASKQPRHLRTAVTRQPTAGMQRQSRQKAWAATLQKLGEALGETRHGVGQLRASLWDTTQYGKAGRLPGSFCQETSGAMQLITIIRRCFKHHRENRFSMLPYTACNLLLQLPHQLQAQIQQQACRVLSLLEPLACSQHFMRGYSSYIRICISTVGQDHIAAADACIITCC